MIRGSTVALAVATSCLLTSSIAWAQDVDALGQNVDLAGIELWVKIAAGAVTGIAAIIGIPAAFLQFSKTSTEIKKMRLEATKLSQELDDARNQEFENHALRITVDHSPDARVHVETAAGLSGPMLVVIDFVVAYIGFQGLMILIGIIGIGILSDVVRPLLFILLFLPVFQNARQARLLLKEVAEARRSPGTAEDPAQAS